MQLPGVPGPTNTCRPVTSSWRPRHSGGCRVRRNRTVVHRAGKRFRPPAEVASTRPAGGPELARRPCHHWLRWARSTPQASLDGVETLGRDRQWSDTRFPTSWASEIIYPDSYTKGGEVFSEFLRPLFGTAATNLGPAYGAGVSLVY